MKISHAGGISDTETLKKTSKSVRGHGTARTRTVRIITNSRSVAHEIKSIAKDGVKVGEQGGIDHREGWSNIW